MVLPKSFKQFRLVHLLLMTAILAVAFTAWTGGGLAGKSLAVCIFGYCAGIGMSFLSDVIDDGEMDDRKASSQVLSTFGAMLIFFSFMFGVCIFLAIVLYYLI